MTQTSKHPLDFDLLKKGDIIPASVIVEAFGREVTDRKYPLSQMNLKGQIICWFAEHEIIVTVRSVGNDLEIIEDELSVPYNRKQASMGLKRHREAIARIAGANVSNLSPGMAKERERLLLVETMKLRALADAAKRGLIGWKEAQKNIG